MAHRNPFARHRAAAGDEISRSSGVLLAIIALAVAGAIAVMLLFPDHRSGDPADISLRTAIVLDDSATAIGDGAARMAHDKVDAR